MSEMRKRWQRAPKPARIAGMIVFGLIAAVFFGFFFGFFIKLLWNILMPQLFGFKEITYWQGVGIAVLSRLIFGSIGGGHEHGSRPSKRSRDRWRCEDDDPDFKGEWKTWKHYDEWWDKEGKKAFHDFSERKQTGAANDSGGSAE